MPPQRGDVGADFLVGVGKGRDSATAEGYSVATEAVRHVRFVGPVNPLAVPIFASSTWVLDSAEHGAVLSDRFSAAFDRTHNVVDGGRSPWLYSRWDNPTADVAATVISRLEAARKTFVVRTARSR